MDGFWKDKLRYYDPTKLPVQRLTFRQDRADTGKVVTVRLPDMPRGAFAINWQDRDCVIAAMVLYLNRICASSDVHLGLKVNPTAISSMNSLSQEEEGRAMVEERDRGTFSPTIPALFRVDDAQSIKTNMAVCFETIQELKAAKTFSLDIFSRHNDMESLSQPLQHNILLVTSNEVKIADVGMDNANVIITVADSEMSISWNPDLSLSGPEIAKLLARFPLFLSELLSRPVDCTLNDVPILSEDELRQHYQPIPCHPVDQPDRTDLLSMIWAFSDSQPDHPALKSRYSLMTYKELRDEVKDLSRQVEATLQRHDLVTWETGAPVIALHLANSTAFSGSMLAAMSCAAVFMPIPLDLPASRRNFMLQDAGCRLMFCKPDVTRDAKSKELPPFKVLLTASTHFGELDLLYFTNAYDSRATALAKDCCYIIYTSGSTGDPKGIQCTNAGLLNLAKGQIQVLDLSPLDCQAQFASIGFDATIAESFTTLLSGGTLAVVHSEERHGRELVDTLTALGVTVVTFPSSLLKMYEPDEFHTLRKVLTAGEACMMPVADKWAHSDNIRLFNAYGPAENTVCATMHEYQRARDIPCEEMSIGQAIPGVSVQLFDEANKPVPSGVVGEIVIGGKSLSSGYIGKAFEKNRERFVPSYINTESSQIVYRTGDHAIRTNEGKLLFLGRVDNQVKIRGQMVNLSGVETAIMEMPSVEIAVVVMRQDLQASEKTIAAFIAPESVDRDMVKTHMAKKLSNYEIPREIITWNIKDFPKNLSMKIDRRKLETLDLKGMLSRKQSNKLTNEQVQIAKIWIQVLGLNDSEINNIEKETSFFDIGGNSLAMVKLQRKIESDFKIKVSFQSLAASPTIESLTRLIDNETMGECKESLAMIDQEAIWKKMVKDANLAISDDIKHAKMAQADSNKKLLFSGATGFLGAFLLNEILQQQTDLHIWCMVRAKSVEKGFERIINNMKNYNLWQDQFKKRLSIVLSELSEPKLGIKQSEYDFLASEMDSVFINAARMDFNRDYSYHRSVNIGGTNELIKLALTSKKKFIFSTSSLAVFLFPSEEESHAQNGHQVVYFEDDELNNARKISGGYAQSKWVSDKLVAQALPLAAGGAVFRPARISGHSSTGMSTTDDFFASFLVGTKQLGVKPDLDVPWDLIPVNFCVKAMVEIMNKVWQDSERTMPTVFHLFNKDTIRIKDMWPDIPSQPMTEWKEALREAPKDNPLLRSIPFFYSDFWDRALRWPAFNTTNTDRYITRECRNLLVPITQLLETYRNYFYRYFNMI